MCAVCTDPQYNIWHSVGWVEKIAGGRVQPSQPPAIQTLHLMKIRRVLVQDFVLTMLGKHPTPAEWVLGYVDILDEIYGCVVG